MGVFACTKIVACMELAPSHSRMVNRESRQCYLSKMLFEKKILPSLQYAHRMFFAFFQVFRTNGSDLQSIKGFESIFYFSSRKEKEPF